MSNDQEFTKMILTYEEYGRMMKELVKRLKEKKVIFKPITGVPRGGLPIGVHLSHHLEWGSDKGETHLVVDDICDTGRTFLFYRNLFKDSKYPFLFATLFYKPKADKYNYPPDIYISTVEPDIWVVFPWEDIREEPNR